jgi:hypothetical protein
MSMSTQPIPSDEVVAPVQSAAQAEDASVSAIDPTLDLYAESELQLRHERTERMIRRALEQE